MTDAKKNIQLKKTLIIIALLTAGLLLFLNGAEHDALYQVSVLSGLAAGDYDGKISLAEIRRHGDFGLGTLDRLDGEAIELDGIFYQVKSSGEVMTVPWRIKTPFMMMTSFNADLKFAFGLIQDYSALWKMIDEKLPTMNIPYAIRVDGVLKYVKTRSVPAQTKPYPALAEVTKNQSVFEFQNIEGTLIGFRMPAFVNGVNVPGYHFHFLSRDKKKGGHVLGCTIIKGEVRIDDIDQWKIAFFRSADFDQRDFSLSTDTSYEVERTK